MSTPELKSKIISHVQQSEDENLLTEIYNLIQAEVDLNKVYVLTEYEKSMVEEGLNDVREGRTYTSEKANELLREWLKK
jgi:predicted transcriptional regulator